MTNQLEPSLVLMNDQQGRLNSQHCPKECTDKIQKQFRPGEEVHDPAGDGDKWIVPADLGFLVNGWSCPKELVEAEFGRIPEPSPDDESEDGLNKQQFNSELNTYQKQSHHRKEHSTVTSQDPTASCNEYWTSRRVNANPHNLMTHP